MSERKFKFDTLAIHAGQAPDPVSGSVMPPIYQTSTYAQKNPGEGIRDYVYARVANPTRYALEDNLAALEAVKYGVTFSSGTAAVAACFHLLKSGDHVLITDDIYGGTFRLLNQIFRQLDLSFTSVDMSSVESIDKEIKPNTKMILIETPTNPMMKIVDLEKVLEYSNSKNLISVVDNTFASPYLQSPADYNPQIILHSTTKYIGGHSDLIGGALMTDDEEIYKQLRFIQKSVGAIPSPWDCFLTIRSTKTLHVRMERHCDNAEKVAQFLCEQAKVEAVYYPGLSDHPGHEIAKKQMKRFGGMISFLIKGGLPGAKAFYDKLKVFTLAESLGGVESLANHPSLMTHASVPKEQLEALGITEGLIRLSVGIEHCDDLIYDLEQALS
ncbi:MAG: cystathionine gamma-synthase [Bdellovibrionota bacterium]